MSTAKYRAYQRRYQREYRKRMAAHPDHIEQVLAAYQGQGQQAVDRVAEAIRAREKHA